MATNVILLVVALLQLVTAVLALASRSHLRRIDKQTNHTNEVLRQVNAAAHADLSAIAHQLADQQGEMGQ